MLYFIWDLLIKVGDLYRLIYVIFCYLYALFILYRAYFASKVYFFICKRRVFTDPKKRWAYFRGLGLFSSLLGSRDRGSHGDPDPMGSQCRRLDGARGKYTL